MDRTTNMVKAICFCYCIGGQTTVGWGCWYHTIVATSDHEMCSTATMLHSYMFAVSLHLLSNVTTGVLQQLSRPKACHTVQPLTHFSHAEYVSLHGHV